MQNSWRRRISRWIFSSSNSSKETACSPTGERKRSPLKKYCPTTACPAVGPVADSSTPSGPSPPTSTTTTGCPTSATTAPVSTLSVSCVRAPAKSSAPTGSIRSKSTSIGNRPKTRPPTSASQTSILSPSGLRGKTGISATRSIRSPISTICSLIAPFGAITP